MIVAKQAQRAVFFERMIKVASTGGKGSTSSFLAFCSAPRSRADQQNTGQHPKQLGAVAQHLLQAEVRPYLDV